MSPRQGPPSGERPDGIQPAEDRRSDNFRVVIGLARRYSSVKDCTVTRSTGIRPAVIKGTTQYQEALTLNGLTGLAHFFLGNTAERVVHKANCSVLTVHPTKK